jgi:hypothetical protein
MEKRYSQNFWIAGQMYYPIFRKKPKNKTKSTLNRTSMLKETRPWSTLNPYFLYIAKKTDLLD